MCVHPSAGRRDQQGTTIHDPVEHQGPLAGIAAGLAASMTDLNVIVACDMPLVRPAVLQRLIDAIGDADIAVAVVDGHASALCGIYRSRVASAAQALLDSGERRVMALLNRVKTKRIDGATFVDIDPNLNRLSALIPPTNIRRHSGRCRATRLLKRHPDLANHLSLQDVAEDMRLDVLVQQVDHLDGRRQLFAHEPEAERAIDLGICLGRTRITSVQHILAGRRVNVSDRRVAKVMALAEVEANIEAIRWRQVDFGLVKNSFFFFFFFLPVGRNNLRRRSGPG